MFLWTFLLLLCNQCYVTLQWRGAEDHVRHEHYWGHALGAGWLPCSGLDCGCPCTYQRHFIIRKGETYILYTYLSYMFVCIYTYLSYMCAYILTCHTCMHIYLPVIHVCIYIYLSYMCAYILTCLHACVHLDLLVIHVCIILTCFVMVVTSNNPFSSHVYGLNPLTTKLNI